MKEATRSLPGVVERKAKRTPGCQLGQPSCQKQGRKGENPTRVVPAEQISDFRGLGSWVCKNSACRAQLSAEDRFCRRCSCCICHLFDDNKDPSLWLVCSSESGATGDCCGLSCHVECALQNQKAGVVDLGQLMQLDGSYCCASCGKVSGILGNWKKQLTVAKDARRVDVLCYRIGLSYRLLDGTSRFKGLHKIVKEAKDMLELEVGTISGVPTSMARGIVSRLSMAGEVQKLCSVAVEKAEESLNVTSDGHANPGVIEKDSRPAACRFLFEEVNSSSIAIILLELSSVSSETIKGYKLWYGKSGEEVQGEDPSCVFPHDQRRIMISKLKPCTEYVFHIVSYTEAGDLGHSEARCFTKSVEIVGKHRDGEDRKETALSNGNSLSCADIEPKLGLTASVSPGFKVRDLGMVLHLAAAQERGCSEGFCSADCKNCCGMRTKSRNLRIDDSGSIPREIDLNVATVPDLNEEVVPPFEFSRDEDNGCSLERAVEADDDAASHHVEKQIASRSHGIDSQTDVVRKRTSMKDDIHDCDSTLINGSPSNLSNSSGCLDENFEYCVKIIRWLECEGHIDKEFRLKFLTWFSLRSTEQERRVVNTFLQTMIDDPSSLSGQLIDSFSDAVSSKRPRNDFCSKPWH
ncbi:hypothetical protein MLD38_006613 [Melastoma candidum]|uniref:Uncharacterized protein n=1 Tax=Melastoma candidum TaxID=119954 RepID=A0ACB9RSM9_9MYRT|nr:hypothetical protein MLD38_006613 [Melastoma candidum]